MEKISVVVTDDRYGNQYQEEKAVLEELDVDFRVFSGEDSEDFRQALGAAQGVLVNQFPLAEKHIGLMKNCRVISRYGSGYENVDVDAATRRGIWVARVPDYCADEVAEHALGLLLSCARRIVFLHQSTKRQGWNIHVSQNIHRIAGKTLGVLGFGSTGRAFFRKTKGMGFGRVLICDTHLSPGQARELSGQKVDFNTLIREADFISIHIPLRKENHHLFNAETFSQVKKNLILINTSRGNVIDQKALISALKEKKLDSAGLDVMAAEPPRDHSELLKLDNVVLTDHCAYYSEESLKELKKKAALNVLSVLKGEQPLYAVNSVGKGSF